VDGNIKSVGTCCKPINAVEFQEIPLESKGKERKGRRDLGVPTDWF
jgi:hypothetical protein